MLQRVQAFVMVLSAYETTANALAFTLYLLSKPENAAALARLTAEVDAFGRERTPKFDELDRFPWLEARPSPITCTCPRL
jgi:cytochrome P450